MASGTFFKEDTMDVRRRNILIAGTAIGLSLSIGALQRAIAAGRVPLVQGMNQINGNVTINGTPASVGQIVRAGDTIATGANSSAFFVVGDSAMAMRSGSIVRIDAASTAKVTMRLITGALASVFGQGGHMLQSSTATVGIRGTAAYMEASEANTYFCLCYGAADITTPARPGQVTQLVSRYHDSPFYISNDGTLTPAPVINHTDTELIMLESLVGRVPPFVQRGEPSRYR